ncbi:hypothetical protein ACH5RR_010914 [Cinchona calisaya]|uniref:Inactive shikimate kinase like 1, chloroplastic n=1 Tax=Cinchona calisaya TaxID=153742 RepID=A0ABD3A3Z7_9GENT
MAMVDIIQGAGAGLRLGVCGCRKIEAVVSPFRYKSGGGRGSFISRRSSRCRRLQTHTALPTSILRLSSSSIANRKARALLNDDTTASSDVEFKMMGVAVEASDPSLILKKMAAQISPELKGTSVFLVGINSSIKPNLGKLLAEALRYYFFDSDELVEEAAGGKSTARLLMERDEKGFRESETEVLKQLSSMGRLVVCAGNGAVQSAANLALLRHGISVWIDVPLDMVAREIVQDNNQLPASESATSGSYPEVFTQLTTVYEKSQSGYTAADSIVSLPKVASKLGYEDLVEVTVEDMALEVLNELQRLTRVKKMMEAAARPF